MQPQVLDIHLGNKTYKMPWSEDRDPTEAEIDSFIASQEGSKPPSAPAPPKEPSFGEKFAQNYGEIVKGAGRYGRTLAGDVGNVALGMGSMLVTPPVEAAARMGPEIANILNMPTKGAALGGADLVTGAPVSKTYSDYVAGKYPEAAAHATTTLATLALLGEGMRRGQVNARRATTHIETPPPPSPPVEASPTRLNYNIQPVEPVAPPIGPPTVPPVQVPPRVGPEVPRTTPIQSSFTEAISRGVPPDFTGTPYSPPVPTKVNFNIEPPITKQRFGLEPVQPIIKQKFGIGKVDKLKTIMVTPTKENVAAAQAQGYSVVEATPAGIKMELTETPAPPVTPPVQTKVPSFSSRPAPPGVNPETGEIIETPPVTPPSPTLPKRLAGAQVRYGMGEKTWTPVFDNDLDKAAYIIAQKKPSKFDADYLKFVMDNTGLDEVDARNYGQRVKNAIRTAVQGKAEGALKIPKIGPEVPPEVPPPSPVTPTTPTTPPAKRGSLLDRLKSESGSVLLEGGRGEKLPPEREKRFFHGTRQAFKDFVASKGDKSDFLGGFIHVAEDPIHSVKVALEPSLPTDAQGNVPAKYLDPRERPVAPDVETSPLKDLEGVNVRPVNLKTKNILDTTFEALGNKSIQDAEAILAAIPEKSFGRVFLRQVINSAKHYLKPEIVAKIGGEELAEINPDVARNLKDELMRAVQNHPEAVRKAGFDGVRYIDRPDLGKNYSVGVPRASQVKPAFGGFLSKLKDERGSVLLESGNKFKKRPDMDESGLPVYTTKIYANEDVPRAIELLEKEIATTEHMLANPELKPDGTRKYSDKVYEQDRKHLTEAKADLERLKSRGSNVVRPSFIDKLKDERGSVLIEPPNKPPTGHELATEPTVPRETPTRKGNKQALFDWVNERRAADYVGGDKNTINESKDAAGRKLIDYLVNTDQLKMKVKEDGSFTPPKKISKYTQFQGPHAEELAELVNNYLSPPKKKLNKVANAFSYTKNFYLAGGIPKTGLNIHGYNILRSDITAQGAIKGLHNFFRGTFKPSSDVAFLEANKDLMPELIKRGYQTHGEESLPFEGKNVISRAAEKVVSYGQKIFEDPLFKVHLPATKLRFTLDRIAELEGKGLSADKATRIAVQDANDFYGGINKALRDKTYSDLARIGVLAPDWFESRIRLGGKRIASVARTGPEQNLYRKSLGRAVTMDLLGKAAQAYAGKKIYDFATGKPGDVTSVDIGETKEGKKRSFPVHGSANEEIRLPQEIGVAMAQGDPLAVLNVVKNRMSQPFKSAIDVTFGIDEYGNPLRNKDRFGRPISFNQGLLNSAREAAKPIEYQSLQALIDLLTGRIGREEATAKALEAPVRYTTKPKQKARSPYSMPR